MKIGGQRLVPAVEAAATDDSIIADGFSCRHQILEATDRQAMHPAQVLKMAHDAGPAAQPWPLPGDGDDCRRISVRAGPRAKFQKPNRF